MSGPGRGAHSLDLAVTRGADGRSRLLRRRVEFPWSLGRGYSGPAGTPVKVIPQLSGAGLLPGDRVEQRVRVEAGASIDLISAGAMLAYGSAGRRTARSDWTFDLAPGSRTRILSEPYVVFDDADLVVHQSLRVAEDASMISIEAFVDASVRKTARWRSETVVLRPDGTVLFKDRVNASSQALARHGRFLGGWSAFGSMTVLGPGREVLERAMECACTRQEAGVWCGWSPLPKQVGVGVRFAAHDGQRLRSTMMRVLEIASQTLSQT